MIFQNESRLARNIPSPSLESPEPREEPKTALQEAIFCGSVLHVAIPDAIRVFSELAGHNSFSPKSHPIHGYARLSEQDFHHMLSGNDPAFVQCKELGSTRGKP